MALTKIGKEGITGVSNASNATFLTVDSSEQAVIKSEGGAVTTSVQQGLCKSWFNFKGTDTVSLLDSFNVGSMTDNNVGRYTATLTNNMSNNNYCISCLGDYDGGASTAGSHSATEHDNNSTSVYQFQSFRPSDNAYADVQKAPAMITGDLA